MIQSKEVNEPRVSPCTVILRIYIKLSKSNPLWAKIEMEGNIKACPLHQSKWVIPARTDFCSWFFTEKLKCDKQKSAFDLLFSPSFLNSPSSLMTLVQCSLRRRRGDSTLWAWARSICPSDTEPRSLFWKTFDNSQDPRPSSRPEKLTQFINSH